MTHFRALFSDLRSALPFFAVTLTLCVVALGGCGPTKTGIENRAAANQRLNIINAQVNFDQAKQAFQTGQFDKAQREINRAIARYPDSSEYYILQGRIFLETHQLEAALESFNTAISMCEKQKEQMDSKPMPSPNAGGGAALLAEQRARNTTSFAEAHYFSGIVFQRWSDDEQAHTHYAKASELEPSKAQYLLAAAESLIAIGDFNAANDLIQPRLKYFEHNAALRTLQAQIAMLQGDARLAATLYGEARMLNPDDVNLLEQMMWAQYAAGMYGQCYDSIKKLQKSHLELAKRQGVENVSKGSTGFQSTAVGRHSAEPRTDLLHLEARCLNMMGRTAEARELYIELGKATPTDPVVWIEMASLSWELGDYRRVATCSVRIIALAPERYEGYMFKGINERHRGNLTEATKLLRQAAERAGDVALPHMLLGQALEESQDFTNALAAYSVAVNLERDNLEARALLRKLSQQTSTTVISSAPTE